MARNLEPLRDTAIADASTAELVIDRDGDGYSDAAEAAAGSDADDAASTPAQLRPDLVDVAVAPSRPTIDPAFEQTVNVDVTKAGEDLGIDLKAIDQLADLDGNSLVGADALKDALDELGIETQSVGDTSTDRNDIDAALGLRDPSSIGLGTNTGAGQPLSGGFGSSSSDGVAASGGSMKTTAQDSSSDDASKSFSGGGTQMSGSGELPPGVHNPNDISLYASETDDGTDESGGAGGGEAGPGAGTAGTGTEQDPDSTIIAGEQKLKDFDSSQKDSGGKSGSSGESGGGDGFLNGLFNLGEAGKNRYGSPPSGGGSSGGGKSGGSSDGGTQLPRWEDTHKMVDPDSAGTTALGPITQEALDAAQLSAGGGVSTPVQDGQEPIDGSGFDPGDPHHMGEVSLTTGDDAFTALSMGDNLVVPGAELKDHVGPEVDELGPPSGGDAAGGDDDWQ